MTVKQRLWCVQVPKQSGESVRSLLVGMGAFESDAAVQRDDDYLYFPVKYEIEIRDQFPDVRLLQRDFECVEKQTFEDILGFTPSYDMIGDIAIIDADDPDAERIADAILLMHRNIKTVLGALSPVQGEFRVRDLRVVAGEPKTETVHKEYGCRYEIDLARVYFTQRLATERKRIADQVGGGDVVVDMFAGAGPFSILAAKSARAVVAIDKNPVATLYLERNARLNRISNMRIICSDVADRPQYDCAGSGPADRQVVLAASVQCRAGRGGVWGAVKLLWCWRCFGIVIGSSLMSAAMCFGCPEKSES
jgi:tRNA (guanine37-N1)-methyltransferase